MTLVAALLIPVALGMVLLDLALSHDPVPGPGVNLYLGLDLGLLAFNLAVVWVVFRQPHGVPFWAALGYVIPILSWSVATGIVEYQRNRNMTAVLLTAFATSAFGLFSPLVNALLLGGTLAAYFGVLFLVPGLQVPTAEDSVALVVLGPLALGVSTTLHRAFVTHVLDSETIQQARLNLIRQEKLASMGVLAAGIAHEINNPLGFIRSNLGVLERNEAELVGPPKVKAENAEIYGEIHEGFQRIGQVVGALRTFGRATDDAPRPYDLDEGVRTTVQLSRGEARDLDLRLELGGLPSVPARSAEINQVVLNVLLNAYQAVRSLPDGTPRWVEVVTRSEVDRVVLEVANSGPPVDPAVRDHLFEPFVSTKGPGEGMGLGLSLAWEIVVNRHGGTLELLPEEPVRFRLTLPQLRTQSTK